VLRRKRSADPIPLTAPNSQDIKYHQGCVAYWTVMVTGNGTRVLRFAACAAPEKLMLHQTTKVAS